MAARAAVLHDFGANAPTHWEHPFGTPDMHVALAIYAKNDDDLQRVLQLAHKSQQELPHIAVVYRMPFGELPEGRNPFDLDLAWTRARFTDDHPAGNHIPDSLQATAQAGITIQNLGPWTASIFGRYFGPRDLIENGSIHSSATTVFNLFDAKHNDITYYYTSRLPGEPPAGVNDFHFHPMESRSFRLGVLYNF